MQEQRISARAGKNASNAAVIAAARQEVTAAQETADTDARTRTMQCVLLMLSGLMALVATVLTLRGKHGGLALLTATLPPALAAALLNAPKNPPLLVAAALVLLAALAFGALTLRKS